MKRRVITVNCDVRIAIRDSIVVSISACHADDPGSIPGRGAFLLLLMLETYL